MTCLLAPPHEEKSPSTQRTKTIAILLAVALCFLRALWPGDVQWILDEPMLIDKALHANQSHRLETIGIMGTHGLPYGPVPVWIYQALLSLTHDPRIIVVLRGVSCALITAAALFSLAATLQLPIAFAVVVLCSPYLWFYDRTLWDNSFNIPLSAIALAAYASFLRTGSTRALHLTVAVLLIMPLIHLMAIILVLPLAAHLLIFHWRILAKRWWTFAAMIALTIFAVHPYLRVVLHSRSPQPLPQNWRDLLSGLRGFEHISAIGLYDLLGEAWLWSPGTWEPLFDLLRAPTILIYLLALSALAMVFSTTSPNLRKTVARLCIAIVIAQMLIGFLFQAAGHAHYFNATWIAFAILAWLGADTLRRSRSGRALVRLFSPSLAITFVFIILRMHAALQSPKTAYPSSLGQQMEIVHQMRSSGTPTANLSPRLRVLDELMATSASSSTHP